MSEILVFYNGEPDGRLYISNHRNDYIADIPTTCIGAFIEALQKHASSEGDGEPFVIDKTIGRVMTIKEWEKSHD